MANILILRNVHDADADIKTGVATVNTENGFAVALGEVSTDRATRNAFKIAAPTAATDKIGLVYNADVPSITDANGNVYKGVTSDPRNITFAAGVPVNVYMPKLYDEIAMTAVDGTASGAKYVIYKASSMKPTYATALTGALLAFEITGTKYVTVGTDRVPTVELMCVNVPTASGTDSGD